MNHQYVNNMKQYLNAPDLKAPVSQGLKEVPSSQLSFLHSVLHLLRIKNYIEDLTKSTHDIH